MDATREDLIRFVCDVRLLIEGPGCPQDPEPRMQAETLIRLNHKLARKYADWENSVGSETAKQDCNEGDTPPSGVAHS
jgi:hypothetical protein